MIAMGPEVARVRGSARSGAVRCISGSLASDVSVVDLASNARPVEERRALESLPPRAELSVADFRRLAGQAGDPSAAGLSPTQTEQALLIRTVEEKFLQLFAQGRMNGTVHTCVGQEFSAVAVVGQLGAEDWVTSNHRCHGHFISRTGNWRGLIDELMGLKSGVCQGIGSSQHLYARGFLSNGPQGALVPVASGIAFQLRGAQKSGIAVSFIGEGTLGEGVVYEAMNLASLWSLPQLFVCENNLYSQSTPQASGIAGTIRGRAHGFGLAVFEANTWDLASLFAEGRRAIDYVRCNGKPAFLLIRTYRLNAHSKGDDDRSAEEIRFFREHDPIARLLKASRWQQSYLTLQQQVDAHVESASAQRLQAGDYESDQLPRERPASEEAVANDKVRMVAALNSGYREALSCGALMIGEDIADPYGGAFKVSRGLSSEFPHSVLSSPISEAALVGFAVGVALMGRQSFAEIMFGDFITNIFDQLISNVSKFHHMYAFQASAPVRIRAPMGGKRGYGPTHSQSLEKHIVGIDNLAVIALSSLDDPRRALASIASLPGPAFIVESKVDYGNVLWQGSPDYRTARHGGALGALVLSPLRRAPSLTVVGYGETARMLADNLERLFLAVDAVVELVVPIALHPLKLEPIENSVRVTGSLLVVEDGSVDFGIGAEVIARLSERDVRFRARRLGACPVPVPSTATLESAMLPTVSKILASLGATA
jgi:2-oxoisovalerate dehydrogenase E1 component